MKAIDKQYLKTPFYGRRRMKEVLNRQGFKIGQKKVSSLMKKMNLRAIYPKEKTSIPNKAHKIYPYLLKDILITRSNQVWCSDITYIPASKGFMYLCVIMDWYSKKVMSWSLSNSLDVDFCVSSLERAIFNNGKPEIFNTDQGSQYTSNEFIRVLKDKNIKISMDSKGRYIDNIFIERLWRSLKYELIYIRDFDSVKELRSALRDWFKYYNKERVHQSLSYKTPDEVYYSLKVA